MLSRILVKLGLKKPPKPAPAAPQRSTLVQPSQPWPRVSSAPGTASAQASRTSAPAPVASSSDSSGPDLSTTMMLSGMMSSPSPEPSRTCWTPPADTGSSYSSDCGSSSSDSGSSCSCD